MISVTLISDIGSLPIHVVMPATREQLEAARATYRHDRDTVGPPLFRGTPSRALASKALREANVPEPPNGFESLAWTTAVMIPARFLIWGETPGPDPQSKAKGPNTEGGPTT